MPNRRDHGRMARLTPSWARPQLDPLPPQRSRDGGMGDAVATARRCERFASGIEPCCFSGLFVAEALATDGNALLTENTGDGGLGNAVVSADLLGGFAGFVAIDDVGDVGGAQEAFRARFRAVLGNMGGRAGDSLTRFRRSDHLLQR